MDRNDKDDHLGNGDTPETATTTEAVSTTELQQVLNETNITTTVPLFQC